MDGVGKFVEVVIHLFRLLSRFQHYAHGSGVTGDQLQSAVITGIQLSIQLITALEVPLVRALSVAHKASTSSLVRTKSTLSILTPALAKVSL